jgi:hypothetical protein
MVQRRWFIMLTCVTLALALAAVCPAATPAHKPEGTLTVAVATFGNERWLPQLYVGAEDVVLKPMYKNLLSRDPKTGELTPYWRSGGRCSMMVAPGASNCAEVSPSMEAMAR